MPYYIYVMNEKVEMVVKDTLEKAHRHCQNPPHPNYMYIIWEGDIEESFRGNYGIPLAMYVKGIRYDMVVHEE